MIYYIILHDIYIDRKKVFSVTNSKPSEFENVQVFSSSRWYSPVNGLIRNLLIENKNEEPNSCLLDWKTTFSLPTEHPLKKASLLTTLPTLTKEWKISFELKPTNYQYASFAQILHRWQE